MSANIVDNVTLDGRSAFCTDTRSVPFVETDGLPSCRDGRSVRLRRRTDRASLRCVHNHQMRL